MEKSQIDAAKDRAQQVVDGVARVRDQQARDVLKLSDHIDAQDQKISELRKIIIEIRLKKEMNRYIDTEKSWEGIFK